MPNARDLLEFDFGRQNQYDTAVTQKSPIDSLLLMEILKYERMQWA